jgi:hypothetical protein
MASVDAVRDAAFDDLVNALDRQTKALRAVLSGRERFKLVKWNEWVTANMRLEQLTALKIKASRRSSPAPSGTKTSEPVLSREQAERELDRLLKVPNVFEWFKYALVRTGHSDMVVSDVRNISTPVLIKQLVSDGEHRERVRAALLEAEMCLAIQPPYSYWVEGTGNGNGDVRETIERDTLGTSEP